jgi:DNA gyrase subunit A
LKRGIDADRLMFKLFKLTPLEDAFSCNFNVLIGGTPRVMGVRELLSEWTAFRTECVRRRLYFDLSRCREKLHLLKGLAKILLDIDKAVRIVRESDAEAEVVPNLMIGFGIDETQAEFVAEIRLRHLNREYILQRTQETGKLEEDIARIEATLRDREKILDLIASELHDIAKKYGQPRKSLIIYEDFKDTVDEVEEIDDYPATLIITKGGYFKKITPQSLRMSSEQKLKEGDEVARTVEASNACDLLFFTSLCQVYKARASDFEDTKASVLGEYIPAKLGFDEGESVLYTAVTNDYKGYMLFAFENGKAAKVELAAYATKLNRKKLVGAFSDRSPLAGALQMSEDGEYLLTSSAGRMLLFHSGAVAAKATRSTQGVAVMTLKPGHKVVRLAQYAEGRFKNPHRYKTKTLPAAGLLPSPEDTAGDQLNLY